MSSKDDLSRISLNPKAKRYARFEEQSDSLRDHNDWLRFEDAENVFGDALWEDEDCGASICKERGFCFRIEIEFAQEMWNEHFFGNVLQKKDFLLFEQEPKDYSIGCGMYRHWKNPEGKEGKALLFLLTFTKLLGTQNKDDSSFEEYVKNEEVRSFGRSSYLVVLALLRGETPLEKDLDVVKKGLLNQCFLKEKAEEKLKKLLEELVGFSE